MIRPGVILGVLAALVVPVEAAAQTAQQQGWAALARRHDAEVQRPQNPASINNPRYYQSWPVARSSMLWMCTNTDPRALRPSAAACRAARAAGNGGAR